MSMQVSVFMPVSITTHSPPLIMTSPKHERMRKGRETSKQTECPQATNSTCYICTKTISQIETMQFMFY